MSTPWTERHGGLWLNRASTNNELVIEQYDPEHDAFTLVWQRAYDGLFEVEYLVRGKARTDPQWSLPFSGDIAGGGIFGTIDDARAHLLAIAAEHQRKLSSG